jgi:hypothetical protein
LSCGQRALGAPLSGIVPAHKEASAVPRTHGMARILAIVSGRDELIQVFRDHTSAMRWITRASA